MSRALTRTDMYYIDIHQVTALYAANTDAYKS